MTSLQFASSGFMRALAFISCVLFFSYAGAAEPASSPEADLAAARAKITAAAEKARANAKSEEEKAIVEADLAFAADAGKRGVEAAFLDVVHPEGKMFPRGAPVVIGAEGVKTLFKGDTSTWEWAPVEAVASGNLGVTWGIAAISGKDDKGALVVVTTRYTSVWRKDDGGKWKMWIDVGTSGPLP